jgi:tRNA (cmo5U34)-methyltransferase
MEKSTVEEIRERFDREVERFSNLETGQTATVDAALALDLVQQGVARVSPHARDLLDIGCGAGNYSLKLLEALPELNITLIDLSQGMLERAQQRLAGKTRRDVAIMQGDIRELNIGERRFDVIVAGMILHHLREEAEWTQVFEKLHGALKSGGSLWISDFVTHEIPAVQDVMWRRYGDYLTALKDSAYRDDVFAYIAKEDSPRSATFQIELLKRVGFRSVDIVHKNSCFALLGAVKP